MPARRGSAPAQLPTPLPELEDPLIDFDTPTDEHNPILAQTYRSPPFREAHLPDSPPLPPRSPSQVVSTSPSGHTCWPTYPSSNTPFTTASPLNLRNSPSPHSLSPHPSPSPPSHFHSLTRTLRSYVPSSIHIPIPSAAPSPPLVSRPLSFGRFSSDLRMDTTPDLGLGSGEPARPKKVVSQQEFERDYEREADDYSTHGFQGPAYRYGYGQANQQQQQQQPSSGLARAIVQNRPPMTSAGMDVIEWARWDVLGDRRLLILAYPAGLQIWDCSDLGAISEVLNLNLDSADWRMILGNGKRGSTRKQEEGMMVHVVHAAFLPTPTETRSGMKDPSSGDRPLLGILMQLDHTEDDYNEESNSSFVLYSLRNHQLVRRLPLSGPPSTFTATNQFIVISMASPPTLLVLSSTTFQTLHIVPSTLLEPFSPLPHHSTSSINPHQQPSNSNTILSTASSTISNKSVPFSIDNISHHHRRRPRAHFDDPHPVFALSHRLLTYASPSPFSSSPPSSAIIKSHHRLSSSSSTPSNPNSSISSPPSPFGLGGGSSLGMNMGMVANMTQAEFGQAALKVGETVLGGMKLLGGMAYGVARNRVSGASGDVRRGSRGGEGLTPGGTFVSRSAPDTAPVDDGSSEQRLRERRFSNPSSAPGYHVTTVAPSTTSSTAPSGGHYITVVDLSPLLASAPEAASSPIKIDEFMSSRSQPIADLHFSADGMSLAVIQRDGHVIKTFKIHPIASVSGLKMDQGPNSMQVYTLRRGRTSAVVEDVSWSKDGRWLAIGTRNRTVHVFPVNPYGGKTDIDSHLEGRVRNVDVISHPLTELAPLIRLRGTKAPDPPNNAPLAFIFISPLDISQSPRLLPQRHISPLSPTIPSSSSHPKISKKHQHHDYHHQQQQQFQDVLLFDPADGVLSLRRLSLDKHVVHEQGLGRVAAAASGVTSISLPGMSNSAGKSAGSPSRSGNTSAVVDPPVMELVAKESTVATWHLQRRTDWIEIKQPIHNPDRKFQPRLLGGDWLAEAELTTCSNSLHVLPRSIYLSHQFSFHTLGEDYHALIRRHQFDICGEEIKVRKQIEISAYSSGGVPGNHSHNNSNNNSTFIEGFSAPRDIRRISSSFDEPIASAISGSFDHSNLPIILPMYPNGRIPGAQHNSFRNSIPIRTMAGIGDSVSEGLLGRIRKEMHKVRSPLLLPRSDSSMSGSVPLAFDEEEHEDFQVDDVRDDDGLRVPGKTRSSTSRGTSREGGTSAESTSSLGLDTPADASIHHHHHHHLPLVDDSDEVVGAVDEEIWSLNGWDQEDALAIDEAEQFVDNISTVGYLPDEEEQQQAKPCAVVSPVLSSKRKGRQRRK